MRTLLRILIYIRFINWRGFWQLHKPDAQNVVVVLPNGWRNLYAYFVGNIQGDLCTIKYLIESKKPFYVQVGKNFGLLHNRNVFIEFGEENNQYRFDNHSAQMQFWIEQLEYQGNKCFLSHKESLLWENKLYMHNYFDEKGIRSPKTQILAVKDLSAQKLPMNYPFIIKWPHSAGSQGLYPIKNDADLESFVLKFESHKSNSIIVQQQLEMRKDIRVICNTKEVVWHYWRINLDDYWRPTSTGFGSKVDFENFPEKWRDWILEQFNKLEIRVGAFDIAWQNDDLETEPYILEVSPAFSPNPSPKNKEWLPKYGKYKKALLFKDSYVERHLELQYNIRRAVLDIDNEQS